MPESQKATLHCSKCGAPISAVLQQLTGWAFLEPEVEIVRHGSSLNIDNVYFDYAGETEVHWDGQMDHPEGLVKCDNKHITKLSLCEVREP